MPYACFGVRWLDSAFQFFQKRRQAAALESASRCEGDGSILHINSEKLGIVLYLLSLEH